MLDFYFNEEPGPYRMQCSVIFIMVLPRRGKYSSWGFSLTHLYFSLHFIHCHAWGGSRRGTCQSLPPIPWLPAACALTSLLVAHIKWHQQEKKSAWKGFTFTEQAHPSGAHCFNGSCCPEGTFLLPPRQDSEDGFPAASASTNGHHNKNCCYRLNKQLCCLILWAMR